MDDAFIGVFLAWEPFSNRLGDGLLEDIIGEETLGDAALELGILEVLTLGETTRFLSAGLFFGDTNFLCSSSSCYEK